MIAMRPTKGPKMMMMERPGKREIFSSLEHGNTSGCLAK